MDEYVVCQISKKKIKKSEAKPIDVIRPGILVLIKKRYPHIDTRGYISQDALKQFRQEYVETIISREKGDLSKLDKEVVKSLVHNETLSKNINIQFDKKKTFGIWWIMEIHRDFCCCNNHLGCHKHHSAIEPSC